MRQLIACLLLFSFHYLVAQNTEPDFVGWGEDVEIVETKDIEEILVELLQSEADTLIFENTKITDSKFNKSGEDLSAIFDKDFIEEYFIQWVQYDKDSLIIIKPYILIRGNLNENLSLLGNIYGIHFNKGLKVVGRINPDIVIDNIFSPSIILNIQNVETNNAELPRLYLGGYKPLDNQYIADLFIKSAYEYGEVYIQYIKVGSLKLDIEGNVDGFYLTDSEIGMLEEPALDTDFLPVFSDSLFQKDGYVLNNIQANLSISFKKSPYVSINVNLIEHPNQNYFHFETDVFEFSDNSLKGSIEFNDLMVNEQVRFRNNHIDGDIKMRNFYLPEQSEKNFIRWDQFDNHKITSLNKMPSEHTPFGFYKENGYAYNPTTSQGYLNDNAFEQLISEYQRFYRI